MVQQIMYPAISNSPGTELSAALTAAVTTVGLLDASKVPAAPNLLTIGTDEGAETVLYTGKSGNNLIGCIRGFDGTTAKAWVIGSKVARYYTAADHNAFKANIEDLATGQGRVDLTQTLGPGTSIITADQNGSELDLTVYGRTPVNLLGALGGGESLSGWSVSGTVELSTTVKRSGNSSFKMSTSSNNSYLTKDFTYLLDASKSYLLGFWAYVESFTQVNGGAAALTLRDIGTSMIRYSAGPNISQAGQWQFLYVKIPTSNTLIGNGFRMMAGLVGSSTGVLYLDEIRIYEVTTAEYAAIGTTIVGDQVDAYWPYVDGKQHVQGVAITNQGRNLLPSSPDLTHANAKLNEPYSLTLTATASSQTSYIDIPVIGGQTYVVSLGITGSAGMLGYNFYTGSILGGYSNLLSASGSSPLTIPVTCSKIRLHFNSSAAGTTTFSNWQLELGSTATAFTPAEAQSAILPVTLGEVGGIRDSVYSAGTEWMYVERVKKNIVLDGSLPWALASNSAGIKVGYSLLPFTISDTTPFRFNIYNGRIGGSQIPSGSADRAVITGGTMFLAMPNADSGWTDAINPTSNALKAFMNGWKASANNGTVYNSWVSILDGSVPTTNTEAWVAVNKAPNWTGWATMDYALASAAAPVAIPNAEGSIALHAGGNQISVETGVIQREKVTPYVYVGYVYLNAQSLTPSWMKNRSAKIIDIYKGADNDNANWTHKTANVYGLDRIETPVEKYDASATYYVTYIAMDKYALTANVSELNAQFRTGLGGVVSDLVQSTAELRQDNDRQDFADDYIQAGVLNNGIDIKSLEIIHWMGV